MRKLTKPSEDPSAVFLTCISKVRDANLKARLTSVEQDIVKAAEAFEKAATLGTLHSLAAQPTENVTQEEMSGVYEYRMVPKDSPGRPFYDKLLASPPHGRCPLCGQRLASTLDHHLPRSEHPALSVVPVNLVPCCSDCNRAKLASIPKTEGEQTLHPYFDDFGTERWLSGIVLESTPPALHFFVEPPKHWDAVRVQRVERHFELFKLGPLFVSHAGEEITNIRHLLRICANRAGELGVRAHLTEMAETYELANPNSWQSAMYRALAGSQWFCSRGFELT
jgi:hypothetical protein